MDPLPVCFEEQIIDKHGGPTVEPSQSTTSVEMVLAHLEFSFAFPERDVVLCPPPAQPPFSPFARIQKRHLRTSLAMIPVPLAYAPLYLNCLFQYSFWPDTTADIFAPINEPLQQKVRQQCALESSLIASAPVSFAGWHLTMRRRQTLHRYTPIDWIFHACHICSVAVSDLLTNLFGHRL